MSTEVTIVGYPFQPTGMAEHARSTFRAFQTVGITPRLLDVADANRIYDPGLERDFGPHLVTTLGEGVNLFGVNGDEAERVIGKVGEAAFARGYNIAYPAWELAHYPKAWAKVLDRFDEIWAPSAFVQAALQEAVSKPGPPHAVAGGPEAVVLPRPAAFRHPGRRLRGRLLLRLRLLR